jgi:hypothetical protein
LRAIKEFYLSAEEMSEDEKQFESEMREEKAKID